MNLLSFPSKIKRQLNNPQRVQLYFILQSFFLPSAWIDIAGYLIPTWRCTGLLLSPSMVSTSWGAASNLLVGLVDTLIGLDTYTQAPNTYSLTDCSKTAWVQIDLGQTRWLHSVTFWSYYDGRVQCSISLKVSATCLFAGEQVTVFSCTSFSTCPTPTSSGFTVSFSAQQARCVRWESGPSTYDAGMHFLEMRISAGQYTCGDREKEK
jgi:hypothetical protein